jgi:PadR family transcriptional regulator, regulatory protein AphA
MKTRRITVLEFALLGLVSQKPRSGYELIRVFRDTPMAHYSDSPGAIYPALARMESAGLLRGKTERVHELRPRRKFEATQRGADELARWLRQKPSQEDVANRVDEVMLRFAFMDAHLSAGECRAFLEELEKSMAAYLRGLKKYVRSVEGQVSRHGLLALEGGIMGCETQLRWVRRALANYDNKITRRRASRV